jgi:hypothetical protein
MSVPRSAARPARRPRGERGVGLMEVIVATVIATLAVVALSYSFGTGRGLVNRYELARVALGAAQRRMELLGAQGTGSPDLALGPGFGALAHGPLDVVVDGRLCGQETWTVAPWYDPSTGSTSGPPDLKRVTVTVTWGGATAAETVQLDRLFPAR